MTTRVQTALFAKVNRDAADTTLVLPTNAVAYALVVPALCKLRKGRGTREVKIGAACGIVPTLRKEREEWGTHFHWSLRRNLSLGHPPSRKPLVSNGILLYLTDGVQWSTRELCRRLSRRLLISRLPTSFLAR